MYLHSAELNSFLSVCEHVSRYGVNCVFCCRASIRFDICTAFISALELFKLYAKFSLACNLACFTPNPQRFVYLHLDGETFQFFPLGFQGYRIMRRHTKCLSPRVDSVVTSCLPLSVPLSDGIRHSGSQFELHTHSCV